jgi:hypothetical protein
MRQAVLDLVRATTGFSPYAAVQISTPTPKLKQRIY